MKQPRVDRTCHCGAVFTTTPNALKLYCSERCSARAARLRREGELLPVKRACHCGVVFTTTPNSLKLYCSARCMRKARRLRRSPPPLLLDVDEESEVLLVRPPTNFEKIRASRFLRPQDMRQGR